MKPARNLVLRRTGHKRIKLLKVTSQKLREKILLELELYFIKCLGTTKIPLVHVILDDIIVPNTADNPAGNYNSDIDEIPQVWSRTSTCSGY